VVSDLQSRAIERGFSIAVQEAMSDQKQFYIGCAGWTLPAAVQGHFPIEGTHLQRYSGRFTAVEINSSFYRPHRSATYIRWAESVPDDFRFSVKVPKAVTHTARLENVEPLLETFISECSHLGEKLGCLLIQLPPSLAWDPRRDTAFFKTLRVLTDVPACCEPRHPSWFTDEVSSVLQDYRVAGVIADPHPNNAVLPGLNSLVYYRLHGSPRVYYSSYEPDFLTKLAQRLQQHADAGREVWCIFDNTAAGQAASNALDLLTVLEQRASPVVP
jgi:uncharacterized protein YecE (DUF72 family)